MEILLYDCSARTWALPMFVDTTWLRWPVPAGAMTIALDTNGLDFAAGGLAILWRSERVYELVEVADITGERLGLCAPMQAAWPVGTRLMLCRTARLSTAPELRRHTDRLFETRLQFEAIEPCDWPLIAPTVRFRGLPVLEDRPDWSDPPTATFARRATALVGDVGRMTIDDISGRALTT